MYSRKCKKNKMMNKKKLISLQRVMMMKMKIYMKIMSFKIKKSKNKSLKKTNRKKIWWKSQKSIILRSRSRRLSCKATLSSSRNRSKRPYGNTKKPSTCVAPPTMTPRPSATTTWAYHK